MPVSRRTLVGAALALLVGTLESSAAGDERHCELPMRVDWSSWLRVGGGAATGGPAGSRAGVLDLGLGIESLIAVGGARLRIGPWGQVSTWSFGNVAPVAGAALMLSVPLADDALMSRHGVGGGLDKAFGIGLRAGVGRSFSSDSTGVAPSGRVDELTLTAGVRTHFLRSAVRLPGGRCAAPGIGGPQWPSVSDAPHGQFYSWGIRGFVTARRLMTADREWQLVGGIEIEPATLFALPRILREWNRPAPEPYEPGGRE